MLQWYIYVTEMDPNHTFIFDYISHDHMNIIMFSKIFLLSGLQNCNYLKHQRNTLEIHPYYINTFKYTKKYMRDLDPLSKFWSHNSEIYMPMPLKAEII